MGEAHPRPGRSGTTLARRIAVHHALDMRGPAFESLAPLVQKLASIVDAGDAAAAAAGVVDHELDHVDGDFELGHSGDRGAAKIVQPERRDRRTWAALLPRGCQAWRCRAWTWRRSNLSPAGPRSS